MVGGSGSGVVGCAVVSHSELWVDWYEGSTWYRYSGTSFWTARQGWEFMIDELQMIPANRQTESPIHIHFQSHSNSSLEQTRSQRYRSMLPRSPAFNQQKTWLQIVYQLCPAFHPGICKMTSLLTVQNATRRCTATSRYVMWLVCSTSRRQRLVENAIERALLGCWSACCAALRLWVAILHS